MKISSWKLFVIIVSFLMSTIAFGCKSDKQKEQERIENEKKSFESNMIYYSRESVLNKLKDPNSANFEDVYLSSDKVVCGKVNSKNSFGGYTGYKRFVSGGKTEGTFIEDEPVLPPRMFQEVWDKMCKVSLK